MICDLCSDPNPVVYYPASDFTLTNGVLASSGAWYACRACRDLIDSNDAKALAERSIDLLCRQHPSIDREWAIEEAIVLHQQFFASRLGQAVAVGSMDARMESDARR